MPRLARRILATVCVLTFVGTTAVRLCCVSDVHPHEAMPAMSHCHMEANPDVPAVASAEGCTHHDLPAFVTAGQINDDVFMVGSPDRESAVALVVHLTAPASIVVDTGPPGSRSRLPLRI